jgi:hypothetical protein
LRGGTDYAALQVVTTTSGAELCARARDADDELLCLMHAGVTMLDADWLKQLVAQLARPGVGIVGCKMVSADARYIHGPLLAGVEDARFGGVMGMIEADRQVAAKGYFSRLLLDQQVSMLHGACVLLRRETLRAIGGPEARLVTPALQGADLSLRVAALGLRAIWSAQVIAAVPAELVCTPPGRAELALFASRYPSLPVPDPLSNPNFTRAARASHGEIRFP